MADPRTAAGIDFLTAMKEGRADRPAFAQTMGFWIDEITEGRVSFRATPGDTVLNPQGVVHGGWYGGLLDTVLGCAVHSTLPAGRIYTTLEYKVNIVRGIPPGTEAVAHAEVQHAGRSTAVARGEIRNATDGTLYATGSTTCIIMASRVD